MSDTPTDEPMSEVDGFASGANPRPWRFDNGCILDAEGDEVVRPPLWDYQGASACELIVYLVNAFHGGKDA